MRRMFAALLLLAFGAAVYPANPVMAEEPEQFKLTNAKIAQQLRSRASKLSTSSTTSDTTYVGGGGTVSAANPWGLEAGPGNDIVSGKTTVYHKGGIKPARAMWDFANTVNEDSLQGWTSYRHIFFSSPRELCDFCSRNREWSCPTCDRNRYLQPTRWESWKKPSSTG